MKIFNFFGNFQIISCQFSEFSGLTTLVTAATTVTTAVLATATLTTVATAGPFFKNYCKGKSNGLYSHPIRRKQFIHCHQNGATAIKDFSLV